MAEETQKQPVDESREALIAEMLRDAEKTEIPGELSKNPIVSRGEETGAPTILREISSAGYVYVWETRTGEKVPVLYYRLGQVLRQRRNDGSYQFATTDPHILPKKGKVKCMLHPEYEERAHYDELGFRTCRKSNLLNRFQLRRHMELKHPQEWKTIEVERVEKEKAEDRALQRLLIESQMGRTTKTKDEFFCESCGANFGSQKTLDKHIEEKHK